MEHSTIIDIADDEHYKVMVLWCLENFGEIKKAWSVIKYGTTKASFMFKREEDLNAFVYAWG